MPNDESHVPAEDVVVMTGDPANGFRVYGPAVTNTPGIEHLTDVTLHGADWWYVPLLPLPRPDGDVEGPATLPAGWTGELPVPGYGRIIAYAAERDGVLVIELESTDATEAAGTADAEARPRVRVYVNDDAVWEHPPFPDEDDGDDERDVRGCSCGQADYGAPGHDGHVEAKIETEKQGEGR